MVLGRLPRCLEEADRVAERWRGADQSYFGPSDSLVACVSLFAVKEPQYCRMLSAHVIIGEYKILVLYYKYD